MEGILDALARNPQIIVAVFFFLVAGAVIRFVSSWLVKAGAVLVVLVLLGVVSSETAKGWAFGTLEAGADFMVEAFGRVVLDEEPGPDAVSAPGDDGDGTSGARASTDGADGAGTPGGTDSPRTGR